MLAAGHAPPAAALPTVTYFDDFYKLPAFFNGEPVQLEILADTRAAPTLMASSTLIM